MNEYALAGFAAAIGILITIGLNWVLRRTIDLQTRELRVLLAHIVKGVKDLDAHLIDLVGILSDSQEGVEKMQKSVTQLTNAVAPAARLAGATEDGVTGVFDGVAGAGDWWDKGERLINNLIGRKVDELAANLETGGIGNKKPLTRKQRRAAKMKMTQGERQLVEMGVEIESPQENPPPQKPAAEESGPGPL